MALNTNFKTKNIEIDEETKEYLVKRIKKFEKFIDEETSPALADIELEKRSGQQTGRIFRAEVNLKIGDRYLRAEEEAENIREAIDAMKDEMIRELRDSKEKERTQTRDGARKAKKQLREEQGGEGDY